MFQGYNDVQRSRFGACLGVSCLADLPPYSSEHRLGSSPSSGVRKQKTTMSLASILARAGGGGSASAPPADTATLSPPLPQVAGYVVVIAIGFLIAFVMMVLTYVLKKTAGEDNRTTEMFITANRSVGRGLTASAVVSSWLWSTAMLGSTLVGYNFGVAGPFWFAAG